MGKQKNKMEPAPTPLQDIYEKVKAYYTKMNAIAKFLEDNHAPKEIRISKPEEFVKFYIPKDALDRLVTMTKLTDCDSLAVYLGLANLNTMSSVTGCILAIDKEREIVASHFEKTKSDPPADGEDTWLPPGHTRTAGDYQVGPKDYTLATPFEVLKTHFHQ